MGSQIIFNLTLDPVAIYGAFLSTILAIIAGVSWIIKKLEKKVVVRCSMASIYSQGIGEIESDLLWVQVINKHDFPITITHVCYITDENKRNGKESYISDIKPFVVSSHNRNDATWGSRNMKKALGSAKLIKFFVTDATGSEYKLPPKELSVLSKQIKNP
jgi:hypothetical protein